MSTPLRSFRSLRVLATLVLAAALHVPATALAQAPDSAAKKKAAGIDWNERAAPWGKLKNVLIDAQQKNAFRLFDNVHYVGLQTVAAYLIKTSEGLVLMDAAYGNTTDLLLANIRRAGFDPKNIKYLIVTHAHGDHFAGAGTIVALSGAKVIMSDLDWTETERRQATGLPANGIRLKRDLVVKDGETLNIGDTEFTFYVTPGHTAGALTTVFTVTDGTDSYRAVCPGGLGFNFGPAWTEPYIKSFERLKELGPFQTVLPNHAYMGPRDLFDVERDLAAGVPDGHPAGYGPKRINAWFDQILDAARQKLAYEQQNPGPAAR